MEIQLQSNILHLKNPYGTSGVHPDASNPDPVPPAHSHFLFYICSSLLLAWKAGLPQSATHFTETLHTPPVPSLQSNLYRGLLLLHSHPFHRAAVLLSPTSLLDLIPLLSQAAFQQVPLCSLPYVLYHCHLAHCQMSCQKWHLTSNDVIKLLVL